MKIISLILISCFIFAAETNLSTKGLITPSTIIEPEKKEDEYQLKRKQWKKNNLLFHRFMRSSEYSSYNPSFLGIKKPHYNGRFDLLPLGIQFTNKTISPNFLFNYFSEGQFLTENEKTEISEILNNIHLLTKFSTKPIHFEYGPFAFDAKINMELNSKINGNLLSIPFQGINIGSTINQEIDIELFSYHQFGIKYGYKLKTKPAIFRFGLGLNFLQGHTFFKVATDSIKISNSEDSISVDISYFMEGSQLIWNQLNSDSDIDVMDTFSNTTQGFDIGFGVNLKNLIKQNIDFEFGLMNLGATLKFDKAKKESYTYTLIGQDLQDLTEATEESEQEIDTTLNYDNQFLEIKIPSHWFVQITYQPMTPLLISIAMEKSDQKRFFSEENPRLTFRTGYFLQNWLNINYGIKTIHGQVMHNAGIGLQFSKMDLTFDFSSYNGWKYNSQGLGLRLRTSFYF